jgi:hypothetical protein
MMTRRVEIYIPAGGPSFYARLEDAEGELIEGEPVNIIDPGETLAVEIGPEQRLVLIERRGEPV